MRCTLGHRKVKRLAAKHNLPIVAACTRGNTEHRIDIWLSDNTTGAIYRDGECVMDKPIIAQKSKPRLPLVNIGYMTLRDKLELEIALRT